MQVALPIVDGITHIWGAEQNKKTEEHWVHPLPD